MQQKNLEKCETYVNDILVTLYVEEEITKSVVVLVNSKRGFISSEVLLKLGIGTLSVREQTH